MKRGRLLGMVLVLGVAAIPAQAHRRHHRRGAGRLQAPAQQVLCGWAPSSVHWTSGSAGWLRPWYGANAWGRPAAPLYASAVPGSMYVSPWERTPVQEAPVMRAQARSLPAATTPPVVQPGVSSSVLDAAFVPATGTGSIVEEDGVWVLYENGVRRGTLVLEAP